MKRAVMAVVLVAVGSALVLPALDARLFSKRKAALPAGNGTPQYWSFVTNDSDYLEVHDLTRTWSSYMGSLYLGGPSHGIIYHPAFQRLYVTTANYVSIIHVPTLTVIGTLDLPAQNLSEMAASTDLSKLYVAGMDYNGYPTVYSINTGPVDTIATQMQLYNNYGYNIFDIAFCPGASQGGTGSNGLFVTFNSSNNSMTRVDMGVGITLAGASENNIDLSGALTFQGYPRYVDVNRSGTLAYVVPDASTISDQPFVLDAQSGSYMSAMGNTYGSNQYYDVIFRHDQTYSYSLQEYNFPPPYAYLNLIDPSSHSVVNQYGSIYGQGRTLSNDSQDTVLAMMGLDYYYFINTVYNSSMAGYLQTFSGGWNNGYTTHRAAFTPRFVPKIHKVIPKGGNGLTGNRIKIEGTGFSSNTIPQIYDQYSWSTYDLNNVVSTPTLVEGDLPVDITLNNRHNLNVYDYVNGFFLQATLYNGYTSGPPSSHSVALTMGTVQSDYRLQSFANCTTADQGRTALFNAMGPYDPYDWRMFMWDAKVQSYTEFNAMSAADSDWTATGFWFLSLSGGTATANNTSSLEDDGFGYPINHMAVPLAPGWNVISSPFPNYWVNWSDFNRGGAMATVGPSSESLYTDATDAISAGMTQLYDYIGGSYVLTDRMEPGRAYWVFNTTGAWAWAWLSRDDSGTQPQVFSIPGDGDPVPPPPPSAVGDAGSTNTRCSFSSHPNGGAVPLGDLVPVGLAIAALFVYRRFIRAG